MPYVLLRQKATGRTVYVSTFHNPADVHGPAQRWRTEATTREVAPFTGSRPPGCPLVAGDMNERDNYFSASRERPGCTRRLAGPTTAPA